MGEVCVLPVRFISSSKGNCLLSLYIILPSFIKIGRELFELIDIKTHTHTDRHTHRQTDTQTDTYESDYRGNPFRVSGVFPSTYHQRSAQLISNIRWENMASGAEIARDFYAAIGPLQLGVVLVGPILDDRLKEKLLKP